MTRRHLMLAEMGITPIWRLRTALEGKAPAIAASPQLALPDPPAAPTAAERSAPPATRVAPRPVSTPAKASEPLDARRGQILRMDWAALQAAVAACEACPLHEQRTRTVFGVGDQQADWLFVGEGPGAEEDKQGEPFVGQAGRLLDNMLAAIALKRGENVYIANVVKCRPPGNRNPAPVEMASCEPYLTRQIALIAPLLIVAMGRIAANHLLATDASIASLRGRLHDYHGTPLIVTYHPAYLLRSLTDKAKAWADLCFARETMTALARRRSAG